MWNCPLLVQAVLLFVTVVLLPGCSGFVLHDASRSKLATDGKQSYADAKVTEVVEVDRKNLGLMLEAELEVVRESSRYEVDYAVLGLANNSTPMGKTWLSAQERIKDLGIETIAGLRKLQDRLVDLDTVHNKLENDRKLLGVWKITVPECTAPMPPLPGIPDGLSADEIAQLKSNYATYVKNCNSLMESPIGSKGKLAAAYKQWKTAEAALEKATTEQQSMREELNAAKIAYDKKVSEAADPAKKGQDLSKEIAAKATTFAGLVMKAKDLGHGLDHDEHISALVDLLTATAGGDVNPEDPSLQRAVAVAKHIPLLAGDMAALEATRTAPPVSGLLIALRHQTLLAETEKTRAALAAERVAILKGKYDLYQQAGERWLRFFDAVCTYAVLSNNKKHPGAKCDTFEVPKIPKDTVDSITCSIDVTPLENCILSHSWKNRLAAIDTPDKPEIKRKLYEAVAAYLQALTLQARPLEQSFREIDVRHREALLAKQGAIAAWDNLVSVPFDQLDAYYKAGVKPAEIADLIVKALGFTAITIGVLQ